MCNGSSIIKYVYVYACTIWNTDACDRDEYVQCL